MINALCSVEVADVVDISGLEIVFGEGCSCRADCWPQDYWRDEICGGFVMTLAIIQVVTPE